MTEHHCACDPHGDNAKCNLECCQPKTPRPLKPSQADIDDALLLIRDAAQKAAAAASEPGWRRETRMQIKARADALARVAAWLEGEAKP